ncbi:MAG: helix-turn-helix transcriptional regulator [Planctomycetes bacterium]|nr:helix-turn-helix transcriptional regulator [Planctomycetota bacterium]
MDLAAQGLRTSAIGSRMGVSELTVEEFIKRARFKLGASSRQELAVRIAALASAAQTPPTSSEDARAFFVEVRSDFDRLLRNLVARVLRALGAQDIGALLAGRTTAVQLADVEHQDCHYILQGMAEATLPTLRCREREITPLLACGLPKEAIALRLGISVLTVKTHAGSIFCKYQVHTWQELAARLMADCAPGLSRTNLPPPPERSTN